MIDLPGCPQSNLTVSTVTGSYLSVANCSVSTTDTWPHRDGGTFTDNPLHPRKTSVKRKKYLKSQVNTSVGVICSSDGISITSYALPLPVDVDGII